jgi:hypothetical protein
MSQQQHFRKNTIMKREENENCMTTVQKSATQRRVQIMILEFLVGGFLARFVRIHSKSRDESHKLGRYLSGAPQPTQ